MKIPFSKYSGSGNEFILIDNRSALFSQEMHKYIPKLCHHTIGADGLILWENSTHCDFKMRIFNADGTEAEMCGNGIRCLMKFIKEKECSQNSCLIETKSSPVNVSITDNQIAVQMPNPKGYLWNIPIFIDHHPHLIHSLDTGVPHAILFIDDLQSNQWMKLAPKIRHHPFFAPRGTNVNFACLNVDKTLHVRTYERGVERETGACGTGATATAIVAAKQYGVLPPITVIPSSKIPLEINFQFINNTAQNVFLIGSAQKIFQSELVLIEDNLKVT